MGQELLTRQEAARFLRLSVSQLDTLSRDGELLRVKLGKPGAARARVLYRRGDLLAFVDAHVEEQIPGRTQGQQ